MSEKVILNNPSSAREDAKSILHQNRAKASAMVQDALKNGHLKQNGDVVVKTCDASCNCLPKCQ